MKKLFFLIFSLITVSFNSQTLSTSLSACYGLNGDGTEPINSLTGTLTVVTPTVDKFNNPNSAVHFNGTGSSFIRLPNSSLLKPSNAVSFSGWVKFDNIIQSHYIVFAHNTCLSYQEGYALIAQNLGTGFKIHAVKSSGACSPATQQILTSSSTMLANTWYHVGAYFGNDSLKVFLNGALVGQAISTNSSFNYDPTDNVYLGGSNLAINLPMNGSLDNVRFYNRKLSNSEFNQLYITDPICPVFSSPICNNTFYSAIYTASVHVSISSMGIPNTSTLSPALSQPFLSTGFAVGPAFGFPATNPTLWSIDASSGSFFYFNGASYINTGHVDPSFTFGKTKYGGSKNFIYSLDQLGQVYSYNGTGNATLLTTVPTSSNGLLNADIVGDDLDNFYILKLSVPQALLVYNHSGTQLCSYSINGIPPTTSIPGGGMAIVGNSVTAYNNAQLFYCGIISGSTINFTQTTTQLNTLTDQDDFASCPITTAVFPSSITAIPNSSVSCFNQIVTLSANSTSTVVPGSYAWSGPGILTSPNSQTIQVNMPGVYTCTLIGCPIAGSISSFTVLSGGSPIPTPTISLTNTLSCSSGTAQLSVAPNSLTNTILWIGPSIVGLNNTPTITINAGGIYSVTLSSTLTGCSSSQTINVSSSAAPLTLSAGTSSGQICFPSAPITLTASGATNYTWAPLGSTVPGTGSLVIANPTTTTIYTVTGTTGVCSGIFAFTVVVIPTPTLIVSGNPTVCAGSPTTLSATGAASYTWFPGNITGGTITVTPTTTTNYTVVGANAACTSSAIIIVVAVPAPTITASASPTIICQGSTSTLTAGGALTYTWQPVNSSGNTVTVSPLTTTIYSVTGKNILGCTSTTTLQLVVNNPTVTISPASTSICTGQSATLSASGATSYTWNPGGANTSSIAVTPTSTTTYTLISINGACSSTNTITITVNTTPTILITPLSSTICSGASTTLSVLGAANYTWMPGSLTGSNIAVSPTITTTYSVTGSTSSGCANTATAIVTVNQNPTITAIANPTAVCSGFPSLLTATGAISYTWTPISSNSNTIVVTPSVTTTYSVSGTNSLNCVILQTVSVLVNPTPTITISASPTIICNGSSSTLTATGATSFSWMPGSLTGTSEVVSPTATTVYTVTGLLGTCNSTKTFTFAVLPHPNISINAVPPAICSGSAALLLATGATNYTWNPGTSNGNTLVVTPSVTSTYTVTGTNASGCTNTAAITVTINPTPTISVISSTNSICSGNSATLTLNGASNYLVIPSLQTGSLVVISPTVNTTYTITGTSTAGCLNTKTISITIAPSPTFNATSSNTLLCNGLSFSLNATGANNYTWTPGNLTGSFVVTTATNAVSVYTVTGETGGCITTVTIPVVVISCENNMFGMTKAAGKPVLVYNTYYNVTFSVTAINASTINLINVSMEENLATAFPAPASFTVINQPIITSQNSGLTINPLFDGTSYTSLTSPSTSTLLANKRDTIVFTVKVDPKGYFGPYKNSVIGFAEFINHVIVSDSSNNGFIWDPDMDGDPTNNDAATIIDFTPIDLFIPDGFTPNGDGINDVFFVKGLNARPVKLSIYNRWGNKVYEKAEYDNSWNAYPNVSNSLGTDKVTPGTYYYVLEFMDGDKETRNGFVVIQY